MRPMKNRIKDGITLVALAAVVAVTLPLVALAAFVSRAVLLGGVIVGVAVGLIVYAFSPSFRRWLEGAAVPEIRLNGLRLATDVALHPAHSWARFDGREVTVGADDLMQSVLGPVDAVELPPVGVRIERGKPLFRLRHGRREVEVQAPVSGWVWRKNENVRQDPQCVNEDPYGKGWMVMLRSDAPRRQKKELFRGERARTWLRTEIDRLLAALTPADAVAATLPDGGVVVDQLHRHLDDATWNRVAAELFGQARDVKRAG